MRQEHYFQLVDWTGRAIHEDKRGHIPGHLADILVRLKIEPDHWLMSVQHIENNFHHAVGRDENMKGFSQALNRCWLKGMVSSRILFH